MSYDFSRHSLDEPLGHVHVQGMQGLFSAVQAFGESEGLTLGDLGKLYGRGVLVPQIAGTATHVADQLETLFREETCDGFVISPAYLPGAFAEFATSVVPDLQRRGLFRLDYHGATLREHLRA